MVNHKLIKCTKHFHLQNFHLQNFSRTFYLLLFAATFTEGYKILIITPLPGPSHILMFKVFVKELVSRGHEVTAITALTMKEQFKNYTEVLIDPPYTFDDICESSSQVSLASFQRIKFCSLS